MYLFPPSAAGLQQQSNHARSGEGHGPSRQQHSNTGVLQLPRFAAKKGDPSSVRVADPRGPASSRRSGLCITCHLAWQPPTVVFPSDEARRWPGMPDRLAPFKDFLATVARATNETQV